MKTHVGGVYVIKNVPNIKELAWGGGDNYKQLVINTNRPIKVIKIDKTYSNGGIVSFIPINDEMDYPLLMYFNDTEIYFQSYSQDLKKLKII